MGFTVDVTESESMTNTQHEAILAELRAMRAVLERSATLAETLAVPVPADDANVEDMRNAAPVDHGDATRAVIESACPTAAKGLRASGKRRGRGGAR
jgi:hypothetical protein